MIAAATTGFFTAVALILAIGAQNAFVLRQGLMRQHVFAVALTCALSDAILIAAGVAGFGILVTRFPDLPIIMRYAGATFLFGYGALRFFAAWKGSSHIANAKPAASLRATILTCLMLTWLNPHVYLDTLGLLGAVSTQFEGAVLKLAFGASAVLSSFVFFFSLAYGAKLMSSVMQSSRAWQVMDVGIGALMWVLALGLILES
jgi:L-lysine exporter family protein LysE/ArgO